MKSSKNWMLVAMVAVLAVLAGFVNSASAAGPGGVFDGTSLGGNIMGQDGPYLYSNSTVNNDTVTGEFNIRLDASQVSLSGANWSFCTDSWDPSQWTAICYMYGYRDSSERWPQHQRWYQQVSPAAGPSISAAVGFDSYEYNPYEWQITQLNEQIAGLKKYLADNPNASNRQEVVLQILIVEVQLDMLEAKTEQTLSVHGYINILPSNVTSSSFEYVEYQEEISYWNPDLGPDGGWSSKWIPAWRAEYDLYGHFLADTLAEAQAMGAQFVPEPATVGLLLFGAAGVIIRRRRNRN